MQLPPKVKFVFFDDRINKYAFMILFLLIIIIIIINFFL